MGGVLGQQFTLLFRPALNGNRFSKIYFPQQNNSATSLSGKRGTRFRKVPQEPAKQHARALPVNPHFQAE
jgi:hypothetical protein